MGFKRRSLLAATFALLVAHEPRSSAQPAPPPAPLVSAVRGVELVVSDLGRSRAFFELLGFTAGHERTEAGPDAKVRSLELELGSERLTLREFASPNEGRPVPPDSRGSDLWFQHVAIVVRDMDRAYGWLRQHRVPHVSSGPQTLPRWNKNAAGIQAFYFADPDGHTLELIRYPAGKGAPRWQTPARCTRRPLALCDFLGIDHTAITVASTDESLALYRDRLGLRVVGTSENYGTEQEHLNGVFGAPLRITALRAAAGPGVELLEYLAPRGGRPAPSDVRPSDLINWQIDIETSSPTALETAVTESGGRLAARSGVAAERLLRDRDGHALFVTEPTTRR